MGPSKKCCDLFGLPKQNTLFDCRFFLFAMQETHHCPWTRMARLSITGAVYLAVFQAGVVASRPTQTIMDPICVSGFEIVGVSRGEVSLSAANDLRVRFVVDTPQDVHIVRFASNFGLTLCHEGGRAFLPNATPDFF